MVTIIRHEVNESLAISGVVETRGLVFVSYCLGNIGKPIEEQINGAFDNLSERLNAIGLTLESVVKIDALFRDVWHIPIMEKIMRQRFNGNYPARNLSKPSLPMMEELQVCSFSLTRLPAGNSRCLISDFAEIYHSVIQAGSHYNGFPDR